MTHRRTIVFSVAILILAAAVSAQQQVTLEILLSAPFPSEIAAAPTEGRVAWIENDKGSRNVWMAAAPDFVARQITAYPGDDGQDITSLTWSPDARAIVYVRGGGANRQVKFQIRRF